jgi:hypothetical protein
MQTKIKIVQAIKRVVILIVNSTFLVALTKDLFIVTAKIQTQSAVVMEAGLVVRGFATALSNLTGKKESLSAKHSSLNSADHA